MKTQEFGGKWTIDKLERVESYLRAYVKVMKKQAWCKTIYIDAFAGTGLNKLKSNRKILGDLLPDFEDTITPTDVDGSAIRALRVEPKFKKYIFIENNSKNLDILKKSVENKYPDLLKSIEFLNGDANQLLKSYCSKMDRNDRAVMFLDPFGMEVSWNQL